MRTRDALASTEELSSVDDVQLEILAAKAAGGDEASWLQLWTRIVPRLDRELARPRFLGGAGQRRSDRERLLERVEAAVRARDFERLRFYRDAQREHPSLRVLAWLRVVAKRVARAGGAP